MKTRGRKSECGVAGAIGRGLAVGGAAELLLLLALAGLTSAGFVAEKSMSLFAAVCALLCSFACAFACARHAPRLKLPLALAASVLLLVCNLALGTLFGPSPITLHVLILAAFLLAGAAAGVIGA